MGLFSKTSTPARSEKENRPIFHNRKPIPEIIFLFTSLPSIHNFTSIFVVDKIQGIPRKCILRFQLLDLIQVFNTTFLPMIQGIPIVKFKCSEFIKKLVISYDLISYVTWMWNSKHSFYNSELLKEIPLIDIGPKILQTQVYCTSHIV